MPMELVGISGNNSTLASSTGTNPYIQTKHPLRRQIAALREQEDDHKLTRRNPI